MKAQMEMDLLQAVQCRSHDCEAAQTDKQCRMGMAHLDCTHVPGTGTRSGKLCTAFTGMICIAESERKLTGDPSAAVDTRVETMQAHYLSVSQDCPLLTA